MPDFETLEELILVRGITPEILYGTGSTKGIIPFLTVYGKTGQININAAPKEVLAALPGMDAAMVERIIEFRGSSEIRGDAAVREFLGAAYPLMAPYASADPGASSLFTVEATGYTDDAKKGYSILATITLDRFPSISLCLLQKPGGNPAMTTAEMIRISTSLVSETATNIARMGPAPAGCALLQPRR